MESAMFTEPTGISKQACPSSVSFHHDDAETTKTEGFSKLPASI